jgi:hypothetical protein
MGRTMRPLFEAAFYLATGLFLGAIGPFGTSSEPILARLSFWLAVTLIGGLSGAAADRALRQRVRQEWLRAILVAALTTAPVALVVLASMILLLGHEHDVLSKFTLTLSAQVFLISVFVMVLRLLARRPSKPLIETRVLIAPPVPEAEAEFRSRLPAKLRSAKLLALEAQDHYVRVYTDAGTDLISARFSDAVDSLARVHGYQVHRSWWVSGAAIKSARWERARGEVELDTGLKVPVSRSGAPALRHAGWL